MNRKLLLGLLFGIGWQLSAAYQRRMKQIPLANKVVIITGASSGIGRATAIRLAAQGAHVVLVARRANLLADLQQEIAPYGDSLAIAADINSDEDVNHVVSATLQRYGRIDVLINNAGLDLEGYLTDHQPHEIQQMIMTNLYGSIIMTREALPAMRRQHSGHIINISSVAGAVLAPGYVSYAATKAGLEGFSTALRREVRSAGIYVTVMRPGWTRTAMLETMDEAEMRRIGLISPLFQLESSEQAAQGILSAIRQRPRELTHGGLGFVTGALGQRLFPAALDWYYANIFNEQEMMQAIRTTGGIRPSE